MHTKYEQLLLLPYVQHAQQIVNKYIQQGCPLQLVPSTQVIVTDCSTSVISWVEDNVVFEHYFMHPNCEVVMHQHPFLTQTLHISGNVQGYAHIRNPAAKWSTDADYLSLGPIHPKNTPHGFRVGSQGAQLFTIQIWPEQVKNPQSATKLYMGPPLGPIHKEQLDEIYTT